MLKNKRNYLKSYLLQQAKISRLKEMILVNPNFKETYRQEIKTAENLRSEIEEKISQMEDEILKELLFQKYILGKTLEEIGYIINYSKRHTERLHIVALEKFKM